MTEIQTTRGVVPYPLHTRPLAILTAVLDEPHRLGATPVGERKCVPVRGGSIEGPRLSGRILSGGSDWAVTNAAGILELNVRLVIETHDGALINCEYLGMRHGPADAMAELAAGKAVDYRKIYFRIVPRFDTADPRYNWLNRMLAVGIGERLDAGPRYHIHEVL
ncbi:DUF3237 domain-containing protein [Kineobactrum sediminis]|uniref:UPF0311 protein CWI75_13730 n=1 Tax=Kineobactrum sediminis TaxID=1905677 RepID=A0A2N5Y078_9GAMM|nr:DUF3237 domain-containing protein [Kineobactrum sediminis]PLW81804.1 DUF3237 domain-containing protein [Kineobactrum sediminis]